MKTEKGSESQGQRRADSLVGTMIGFRVKKKPQEKFWRQLGKTEYELYIIDTIESII